MICSDVLLQLAKDRRHNPSASLSCRHAEILFALNVLEENVTCAGVVSLLQLAVGQSPLGPVSLKSPFQQTRAWPVVCIQKFLACEIAYEFVAIRAYIPGKGSDLSIAMCKVSVVMQYLRIIHCHL